MSNIITRRRFIEVGTGVATSLLLTQNKRRNIDRQPSIVLVVADDLGIETLIPYGSQFYDTPHIHNLAKEGLLFRHCYATPLCTPSRVELMTGKYSHRNYVTFAHLPKGETTFAHVLKRAGYRTCIVGKWQLWASNGQLPSEAGFDEYALSPAPAAKSGIKVGKGYYWFPKVNKNDVWQPTTSSDYGPNIHLDYLLEFIERHRNQPFFAYYAQHLPHAPYDATPLSSDIGVRRNPAVFPEMVAYLDYQIGRILQKLNELRMRDNTIVIFTSDNGTPGVIQSPFQRRTVRGGKGLLNDRGTRVPLIVSWPGTVMKDAVTDSITDFVDVLPTISAVAGIDRSQLGDIDGYSFLPLLKGETDATKGYAFTYFVDKTSDTFQSYWARTQRWKLYDDGRLFDIRHDPEEQSPITASEDGTEARQIRHRLEQVIHSLDL